MTDHQKKRDLSLEQYSELVRVAATGALNAIADVCMEADVSATKGVILPFPPLNPVDKSRLLRFPARQNPA